MSWSASLTKPILTIVIWVATLTKKMIADSQVTMWLFIFLLGLEHTLTRCSINSLGWESTTKSASVIRTMVFWWVSTITTVWVDVFWEMHMVLVHTIELLLFLKFSLLGQDGFSTIIIHKWHSSWLSSCISVNMRINSMVVDELESAILALTALLSTSTTRSRLGWLLLLWHILRWWTLHMHTGMVLSPRSRWQKATVLIVHEFPILLFFNQTFYIYFY